MKLFIVVRSDLAPGLQLAQSGHALVAFQHSCSAEYEEWYRRSNNLVVLGVENEVRLAELAKSLTQKGVKVAQFREPDLDGELTAICVGSGGQRWLGSLPLALKQAA